MNFLKILLIFIIICKIIFCSQTDLELIDETDFDVAQLLGCDEEEPNMKPPLIEILPAYVKTSRTKFLKFTSSNKVKEETEYLAEGHGFGLVGHNKHQDEKFMSKVLNLIEQMQILQYLYDVGKAENWAELKLGLKLKPNFFNGNVPKIKSSDSRKIILLKLQSEFQEIYEFFRHASKDVMFMPEIPWTKITVEEKMKVKQLKLFLEKTRMKHFALRIYHVYSQTKKSKIVIYLNEKNVEEVKWILKFIFYIPLENISNEMITK